MQKKALILAAIAAMPLGLAHVQAQVDQELAAPLSQAEQLTRGRSLVDSQAVYSDEDAFDAAVEHLMTAAEGSDATVTDDANLELGILYFNAIQSIADAERAQAMSNQVTRLFSDLSAHAEGRVEETATALLSMHALNTGNMELAGDCVRKIDVHATEIPAVPMIVRSYHLAQGDASQACSVLEDMVTQAQDVAVQAEASFALGELLAGMGDLDGAQTRLEDATERFRSLGAEDDAAQIEQYYLEPLRNAKLVEVPAELDDEA